MSTPAVDPSTPTNGTIPYRIGRLEEEVKDLRRSVGRLTWVMLTASVTLSVSSVVFAATVLLSKGAP